MLKRKLGRLIDSKLEIISGELVLAQTNFLSHFLPFLQYNHFTADQTYFSFIEGLSMPVTRKST